MAPKTPDVQNGQRLTGYIMEGLLACRNAKRQLARSVRTRKVANSEQMVLAIVSKWRNYNIS